MLNQENMAAASELELNGAIEMRRNQIEELFGQIAALEQFKAEKFGITDDAAKELDQELDWFENELDSALCRIKLRFKKMRQLMCGHRWFPGAGDFDKCARCGAVRLIK